MTPVTVNWPDAVGFEQKSIAMSPASLRSVGREDGVGVPAGCKEAAKRRTDDPDGGPESNRRLLDEIVCVKNISRRLLQFDVIFGKITGFREPYLTLADIVVHYRFALAGSCFVQFPQNLEHIIRRCQAGFESLARSFKLIVDKPNGFARRFHMLARGSCFAD